MWIILLEKKKEGIERVDEWLLILKHCAAKTTVMLQGDSKWILYCTWNDWIPRDHFSSEYPSKTI